jgi:hypothetical protein
MARAGGKRHQPQPLVQVGEEVSHAQLYRAWMGLRTCLDVKIRAEKDEGDG